MTNVISSGTDPYRSTLHRDGTVTVWDVYSQQWERHSDLSDEILATLGSERDRVVAHISRSLTVEGAL